jgi:hypothetical protein
VPPAPPPPTLPAPPAPPCVAPPPPRGPPSEAKAGADDPKIQRARVRIANFFIFILLYIGIIDDFPTHCTFPLFSIFIPVIMQILFHGLFFKAQFYAGSNPTFCIKSFHKRFILPMDDELKYKKGQTLSFTLFHGTTISFHSITPYRMDTLTSRLSSSAQKISPVL